METGPGQTIYKNKCCVPGCTNKAQKRHRFPKNVQLLKKWVENIKAPRLMTMQPEEIYRSYYVCDKHFAQEYLVPGTKRGLTRDAIPTLHMSIVSEEEIRPHENVDEAGPAPYTEPAASCEHAEENVEKATSTSALIENVKPSSSSMCPPVLQDGKKTLQSPANPQGQELQDVIECATVSASGSVPYTCGLRDKPKRKGILQSVDVTRSKELTPRCKKFYQMVTTWAKKTASAQHKIKSLRARLANAEKVAKCPNFEQMMTSVNDATYMFIMQQLRTQKQHPKARRFTLDEKILSLTLLKSSAKAYRLLSKLFSLPSPRTLTNMLNKIPYGPGINKQIFNSLKVAVTRLKSDNKKLCAVVFDEIAITPSIHYDVKSDKIEGLEDYGYSRSRHLADTANVFLLKGVFRQWKQALSFTFSKGPMKSHHIKKMLVEIIKECQSIGLNVVVTICDQGSANQAAINSLLKDTQRNSAKAGLANKYSGFLVNQKEIIPLYDVPHLFKGIRNNLISKNLHYYINNEEKIAKWTHIERLYLLDTMDNTRMCPKLTDSHIFPKKMNKMKVSLMAQIFSNKVGALIKRFAGWDTHTCYNIPLEAAATGDFILHMDKLFDSLNGNRKTAPESKPLKGGVTRTSNHENFWKDSITFLEKARFFCPKKQKLIKVPSLINLVKTLKNFIYLKQKLLTQVEYFLPRAFNQDCLENFFASLRTHGRRNVSPDVSHFVTSFKALVVNNFISSHSPAANCEEDVSRGALDTLRCFLTGEEIAGIHPLEANAELAVPVAVFRCKLTPIAKATLAYIAGFIGKKMLKCTNCATCRQLLLTSDGDVPTDIIEASRYKSSELVTPGSYLYFVTSQACSILFYVIPRNCQSMLLSKALQTTIRKHISFDVLNCNVHSDLGTQVLKMIVKTVLYFWCKQINKILIGRDEKFVLFLKSKPDVTLLDPVKVEARNKYLSTLKYKRKT